MSAPFATTASITLDKAVIPLETALKDNGFVFIRVLESSNGGKALVSFAGHRFEVQTAKPLRRGDSFAAKIHIADGKVFLEPQLPSEANVNTANNVQSLFFSAASVDAVWTRLFQYIKETGAQFTSEQLQKIRRLVKRAKITPETAAEIAAYLEEKGIDATPEHIDSLSSLLSQSGQKARSDTERPQKSTHSFLDSLYRTDDEVLSAPSGLLTAANHLGTPLSHWIVLPFAQELGGVPYTGNIRMLLNIPQKRTELIYITARNAQNSLTFKIFPPKMVHGVMHIYYASVPETPKKDRAALLSLLTSSFVLPELKIAAEYSQEISNELFVSASSLIQGVDVQI